MQVAEVNRIHMWIPAFQPIPYSQSIPVCISFVLFWFHFLFIFIQSFLFYSIIFRLHSKAIYIWNAFSFGFLICFYVFVFLNYQQLGIIAINATTRWRLLWRRGQRIHWIANKAILPTASILKYILLLFYVLFDYSL